MIYRKNIFILAIFIGFITAQLKFDLNYSSYYNFYFFLILNVKYSA